MTVILIIALLIAVLDITGFACTEEVEHLLYTEENEASSGDKDADKTEEKKKPSGSALSNMGDVLKKRVKRKTTGSKEEEEPKEEVKRTKNPKSDKNVDKDALARDAEEMLEDVYREWLSA